MSRRPRPTAESKARAERIARALEGLLDEVSPTPEPNHHDTPSERGDPYRPEPSAEKPSGRRVGLDCPSCGQPMAVDVERGVRIHRCVGCHGLWLDPGDLPQMIDDPGPVEPDLAAIRAGMANVHVQASTVAYRRCPQCSQVMERRNYGAHSGVVVDECRSHGMFLDPGEFEAIETFIELGGLSLTAVRERQQRRESLRKSRRQAALASNIPSMSSGRGRAYTRWGLLLSWFF